MTNDKVDKIKLQQLRELTGCGMMDCRKALEESNGDLEKAIDILRKKGASVAAKRAIKETTQGVIKAYIHPGDQIGVLVELNCETDFVARTPEVQQFASDICMHIAAFNPLYLAPENVDQKFLEHEKELIKEQLANTGKPAQIIEGIVEGKLKKLYSEICLLDQKFLKDDLVTVREKLQSLIAKTGENIKLRRFARFEIGK